MRYVDPARTAWCDPFFQAMAPAAGEEILAAVARLGGAPPAGANDDLGRRAMSGWSYWTLFVRGYLLYDARGDVGDDDPYLRYLVTRFGPEGRDPGIARELAEPAAAARRITRRYRNCDLARGVALGGRGSVDDFDPVIVVTGDDEARDSKPVFDADDGECVWASALDGYHRLFAARLFGLERLPCRVVEHAGASR
ncbi:MAG TPA: hypothetical protein VGJ70_19395 [Solirubrobacteraceae bacterium]|jgi:hypothetical protein